jgi:hypothetical protein
VRDIRLARAQPPVRGEDEACERGAERKEDDDR